VGFVFMGFDQSLFIKAKSYLIFQRSGYLWAISRPASRLFMENRAGFEFYRPLTIFYVFGEIGVILCKNLIFRRINSAFLNEITPCRRQIELFENIPV
jgi:hypothetical protein